MKGRSNKDEGQSKTAARQVGFGLRPSSFVLSTCFVLCTLSFVPGLSFGSTWTTDGTDSLLGQLDRIEFENVSIHGEGTVTLAPALATRQLDDAAAVWQTALDRDGNVYVATGNQGRVYRIGRTGRPELVFDSGTGEILALTADASGTVYFGTTPEAKVYRVRPGGKPELLCSTDESYVFSLLADPPSNSVYAATGEHGRLLRITAAGRATEVFAARQAHLTALAWLVPGKELLVGTSPDGIVYRLSFADGAARPAVSVLYDTPLNEVRAIAADGTGRVYIGANAGGDGDRDSTRAGVFFIDRSGIRRWLWTAPDSTVFGLALAGTSGQSRLLVATGNKGMVYELDTLGRVSVRYRLKETQALCLTPLRSGLRLGTGNPGKLYQAGSAYADSGFITSPPHDCTNPALFGMLSFRANVPAGTGLSFETRSGNSEKPDSTWSQWSAVTPGITSPPRRFVQWRCHFRTSFPNLTPELQRVDVYYRSANLAPVIKKFEIPEPSLEDARKGVNKPARQVTWEATDPDSDSLSFELFFRRETEASWQQVGREVTESRFDLDTRALPDGWYELRLVASDKPTQPAGAILAAEQTSLPFLVDNTAPAVAGPKAGTPDRKTGLCRISFSAQDALSPIAAARVSVNAGDWLTLEPEDHVFDSGVERFSAEVRLPSSVLGLPSFVVSVWVADAQGNIAAARTAVRLK
jgi:sugar lactone lactonase YvrE